MAFALVQESTLVAGSGSPITASISLTCSAGNAIVVFVGQTASGVRSYAIADNIDGTTGWATAKFDSAVSAFCVGIFYKVNIPAGITTITVPANTGTNAFNAAAQEWSGFGTAITVDASDVLLEGANSNNHTASASGVTSANPLVAFVSAVLTSPAGVTDTGAGTGYTEVPSGTTTTQTLKESRVFNSGCTSEVGAWTSAGTARIGHVVMALLSGNAAAAGGKPWTHYAQQMSA